LVKVVHSRHGAIVAGLLAGDYLVLARFGCRRRVLLIYGILFFMPGDPNSAGETENATVPF
jgi:hypothetical protein